MTEKELQRITFKYEIGPGDRFTRISLTGRLDVFNYQTVQEEVEALLEGKSGVLVVVDLSEVEYVASAGWSVFFTLRKKMVLSGGKLALYGMQPTVAQVYLAMRIQGMVPSFATLEEAEDFLNKKEE